MRRLAPIAALLYLCLGISAAAQTQFGSVTGRVSDVTGALISQAKVTLTNTATNIREETATNPGGIFVFANVGAGVYEVRVENQGFRASVRKIKLEVAQRANLDFLMQVGEVQDVVTNSEDSAPLNTSTGEVSRVITERELFQLPLLDRNPYVLVGLTPGAANTAAVTGDNRGLGLAIAGQRSSSINFLLDGAENNDPFSATVGQMIPLDAVQEFRVQASGTTSSFGRNPIVTNVVTKSGSSQFHGSGYEFYRGAALSGTPFDDNANGLAKSNFVRNQFGASLGGPIIKDNTFFFISFEGLRIRSSSSTSYFVPTQTFLNNSSANTANFINAFGGLPKANDPTGITAQQVVEVLEGGGPGAYATNPLINPNTGMAIPANAVLFQRENLLASTNAGAGDPQNTWLFSGRVDHRFSDNTNLTGRYSFQNNDLADGTVSLSPYQGFNTGMLNRNQSVDLSLTHSFTPRLLNETRFDFNRFLGSQPLASAPVTTPCLQYRFSNSMPTGSIVFPGYSPTACGSLSLPFGGPQNIFQVYDGATLLLGRQTIRAGGGFEQLRDNRTFGANASAVFQAFTLQSVLNGSADAVSVAIDPNNKVPGQIYNTAIDGPFRSPSFTRHFRQNEFSLFAEDSVKIRRGLMVTAGVRYEYFGEPHSPDGEQSLDSNLFLGSGSSIYQQVSNAAFMQTNQFYKPDYNNVAPRIGIAYDIFGNGKTVLRAGYGLYYDRNFGNALFNVFQNPPAYLGLSLLTPPAFPITVNQFDSLNSQGQSLTLTGQARQLNQNLKTAYSEQFSASLEHDFGKGIIGSISYLGQNGIHLYSLNNLNQIGSCLLLSSLPCAPAAEDASSRLNQTGITNINSRGNDGLSRYNAMTAQISAGRLGTTGLSLNLAYTYARNIDNESSFFNDSPLEGGLGFIGFRDPFDPSLDRANSTNDIRNRFTLSGVWDLPFGKNLTGVKARIFQDWSVSGVIQAQTGGAFSVYDNSFSTCNDTVGNFCYPVLTGAVPGRSASGSGFPNTFNLYSGLTNTFTSQNDFCGGDLTCTARLSNLTPGLLSPRNLFRTPGFYNVDLGLQKVIKLPREGTNLQFRSEFYNLFNHSNLFVNPGTNEFNGADLPVTANKGIFPFGDKERREIQLGLRLTF